jgi:hypothetical protein
MPIEGCRRRRAGSRAGRRDHRLREGASGEGDFL